MSESRLLVWWTRWWHAVPVLVLALVFSGTISTITSNETMSFTLPPMVAAMAIPVVWGWPERREFTRRFLTVTVVGALATVASGLITWTPETNSGTVYVIFSMTIIAMLAWLMLASMTLLVASLAYVGNWFFKKYRSAYSTS